MVKIRVLALDLSARHCGFVVMDDGAMASSTSHGTIEPIGKWGSEALRQLYWALFWRLHESGGCAYRTTVIAYEAPGWAGQTGRPGRWGTSMRTRLMFAQAEAAVWLAAAHAGVPRIEPLPQDEVKAVVAGHARAKKAEVKAALILRRQAGELGDADIESWDEHQVDALAVGVAMFGKLRIEQLGGVQ